jgi:hypothetical protein
MTSAVDLLVVAYQSLATDEQEEVIGPRFSVHPK